LPDSKSVGPGKKFTTKQKDLIYAENRKRNNGVLKDDDTGQTLVPSKKSMSGIKNPPKNEAQVDHIIPRKPKDPSVQPGTNSFSNAKVISRARNRAKSNN
jgi:filamentous hemagglutinin